MYIYMGLEEVERALQAAMAKVHPNAASPADPLRTVKPPISNDLTADNSMTVWRKSLLLSCSGFTVFDASGNLAFRVDNYSSGSRRREVVLMDAAGKPLITIRRKKLSLAENWLLYNGEDTVDPVFSVKRRVDLPCSSKALARVTPCGGGGGGYSIEGSFSRRCCVMYDERRRVVTEIRRKEAAGGVAFGGEVFRLIVQPEMEGRLAMAIVIVLDKMFGCGAT